MFNELRKTLRAIEEENIEVRKLHKESVENNDEIHKMFKEIKEENQKLKEMIMEKRVNQDQEMIREILDDRRETKETIKKVFNSFKGKGGLASYMNEIQEFMTNTRKDIEQLEDRGKKELKKIEEGTKSYVTNELEKYRDELADKHKIQLMTENKKLKNKIQNYIKNEGKERGKIIEELKKKLETTGLAMEEDWAGELRKTVEILKNNGERLSKEVAREIRHSLDEKVETVTVGGSMTYAGAVAAGIRGREVGQQEHGVEKNMTLILRKEKDGDPKLVEKEIKETLKTGKLKIKINKIKKKQEEGR